MAYRRVNKPRFISLALAMAALTAPVFAQDTEGSKSPAALAHTFARTAAPIKIGSGDLLDVFVYDEPDLNQVVRVEDDGTVNLPLIGSVKVNGLTAQDAGALVARELKDGHFLLTPQVTVLVSEYATQGVSVTGEVQHPGVYQVLGARTLLDVISLAGGFTSVADTKVTIKRRSGAEERFSVNLKAEDARQSVDDDVQVFPGDLVMVPRAGVVYVLGDVARPGGFVMQDSGKITLLQALAEAGGTNRTASMNSAVLMHKQASGYTSEKIRVGDLVHGRANDIELTASDILYIPGNRFKLLASNSSNLAQAAAGAAVYHVVP